MNIRVEFVVFTSMFQQIGRYYEENKYFALLRITT